MLKQKQIQKAKSNMGPGYSESNNRNWIKINHKIKIERIWQTVCPTFNPNPWEGDSYKEFI